MNRLSTSADLAAMNIHQLANLVQTVICNDADSDFRTEVEFHLVNPQSGSAVFTLDVVSIRGAQFERGINTPQRLNHVIDGLYRQFRAHGLTFTQPIGIPGSTREGDRIDTGRMSFTIATRH